MMANVQTSDFRSRVDRINSSQKISKRAIYRDQYGVLVAPGVQKPRFKWMSIIRPLILIYVAFTVFKAVFIYSSDQNNYAEIISNLEVGDSKSQIVAYVMAPGYFTEPVGVFIANLAERIKEAQKK